MALRDSIGRIQIVSTRTVFAMQERHPALAGEVRNALVKFRANDWGISQDKAMNDADPKDAMGVYEITECEDENRIWIKSDNYNGHEGISQVITIMFPSDY